MKTGAVIPAGFSKSKIKFFLHCNDLCMLFSFLAGSAQINGSVCVHMNTSHSLYEVNSSFARYCHLFVSDKTDARYFTKI
jgi:hypothetical protein